MREKETAQQCDYCKVGMRKRKATEDLPYAYTLSGLSGVFLIGITVHECPTCGFEMPIIPRVEELHDVIALQIAQKATVLSGEEIRFLRKHAAIPANKFARLLGIDPSHLSRVENGHIEALGAPTDRLARVYAILASQVDDARQLLLEVAEILDGDRPEPPATFRIERNRWKAAA